MTKIVRWIQRSFFYILSVALSGYVLLSIGPANIVREILSTDFFMAGISLLVALCALIIRVYKLKILSKMETSTVMQIFIASRLGKEISFVGYFIPLAEKKNRENNTFSSLIADRYIEIFATLLLALLSCIFVLGSGHFETILFLSIAGAFIFILAAPFFPVALASRISSNNLFNKLITSITLLQQQLKLSRGMLLIYVLSIISTILDFVSAQYALRAYEVEVNVGYVAIVWASSAMVSMIAFMIIGSTEITVIYLYQYLARVGSATTASFVILSRAINLFALGSLFLYTVIFNKWRAASRITKSATEADVSLLQPPVAEEPATLPKQS